MRSHNAIDRATRWVYVRIYADQSEKSSTDFLRRLHAAVPMKIETLLSDNGSQFTDRFTSKGKEPPGNHAFDRICTTLGIEYRLIKPRHPQTNGMVERFNGRISDVLATGFYPDFTDTSKKPDDRQKGVSCPSEESLATSSSVRPLA